MNESVASRGGQPARDPGLQIERTIMAWWRTLVSMIVVDIFAWRALLLGFNAAAPDALQVSGLLLTAVGTAGLSVCFYLRQRNLRRGPSWAPASSRIMVYTTLWLLIVVLGGACSVLAVR